MGLGTLMLTFGRFFVFQVRAFGGSHPVQQPAELSGKSSQGNRQVLTMGTERKPLPSNWQKGAPLPAA